MYLLHFTRNYIKYNSTSTKCRCYSVGPLAFVSCVCSLSEVSCVWLASGTSFSISPEMVCYPQIIPGFARVEMSLACLSPLKVPSQGHP